MKSSKQRNSYSSFRFLPDFVYRELFDETFLFFLQFGFFLIGLLLGAVLSENFLLFDEAEVSPVIFSGIPSPSAGFLSCFSTLLLNSLLFLLPVFLLGLTVFGSFIIPVIVLFKGCAVAIGMVSFLRQDGLYGWGMSSWVYALPTAFLVFLILLLASCAFRFSNRLVKAGFSSQDGVLDFSSYFKDLLWCLCSSVAVSLIDSVCISIVVVFFHRGW